MLYRLWQKRAQTQQSEQKSLGNNFSEEHKTTKDAQS